MITSPPYWHIKDYGEDGQIGYGQSLHDYLKDLYLVWKEIYRVLEPGRRACINIGDQFLRASVYGRYKIVPLHAEIILQMERIGFDFMGSIIWNKRTTMKTTGGATIMGSYPYPPNGIVEIDYEHILIFKKPGKMKKFDKELKDRSKLSKQEWKDHFISHWTFGGARQSGHEAMFPEELPSRLIKMFSFEDEIVLDPFLGSGTTALAAMKLGRNCFGYEISREFIELQKRKLGDAGLEHFAQKGPSNISLSSDYIPSIPDIRPMDINGDEVSSILHKVLDLGPSASLMIEDMGNIVLQGLDVSNPELMASYLREFIIGKKVVLEEENGAYYVYLPNKIFVNKELIRCGGCSYNGDKLISKSRILERASQ